MRGVWRGGWGIGGVGVIRECGGSGRC